MQLSHPQTLPTSVRLFPRLATKAMEETKTNRRRATQSRREIQNSQTPMQRASSKEDVRIRLLKMIVDSERARRQEPHAG